MKNLSAFALLLSLCLFSCGKKTDDPQAAVATAETVTEVPGAPVAPAGSPSASKMQVRVTGVALGSLHPTVLIDAYAAPLSSAHTVNNYTKTFSKSDFVEVFNIGTAAPYVQGGLVYRCDIQGRINGVANTGVLPAGADMRIELLKDGVVIRDNIANGKAEWRTTSAFIYSSIAYSNN